MRTTGEIRLQNLEVLIQEAGGAEALADRVDSSAVYISQIRNRAVDHKTKKQRELGTQMARRLEVAFQRPRGWMDVPHDMGVLGTVIEPLVAAETRLPYGMLTRMGQSQTQADLGEAAARPNQHTTMGDAPFGNANIALVTNSITTVPILAWASIHQMLHVTNAEMAQPTATLETFAECSPFAKFIAMPDDSMAPDIAEGDHLLIDPEERPRAGDVVLVRLPSGEHFVRQFKPRMAAVFDAVPLNTNYQALSSRADGVEVLGVMLEHRRYRKRP